MATTHKKSSSVGNGTQSTPTAKPFELAITLPQSPGTRIHLHLTISTSTLMLFLTSASAESGGAQNAASLGSFVYAMPDRYNSAEPLSTPLYTLPSSVDFATRMAKVLVRKTGRVCYVGSSVNLAGAAGGGTVEEEMEAFRAVVRVVGVAVVRAEAAEK